MDNLNGNLAFKISLDTEKLKQDVEDVKNMLGGIAVKAEQEGNKMDKAFGKLGTAIAGVFTLKGATDFVKQCINVRGEIEKLSVSFETLLGDKQKADAMMAEIRDYAVKTPLQTGEIASAAQQMLSFNIAAEEVMPTLKAIGDISMGDSQRFQSLALAFSQMSSTGKLMGQDLLQMINAGFNPLSVISEQTGKSIGVLKDEMSKGAISAETVAKAFKDAASEGGKFNGMLETQSHTLKGVLSNLEGAFQDMLSEVGEQLEQPVLDAVDAVTNLMKNYETIGKILAEAVVIYGSYKTAVMAASVAEKVATGVSKGYTVAQQMQYTWLLLVEKAQKLLNATMLNNPYVLAATALVSIVSALILFKKRASEAELAQASLNSVMEESANRQNEITEKTNSLLQVVEDETASNLKRMQAYKSLQAMYPEYLANLEMENFLLENQDEVKKRLSTEQDILETNAMSEEIAQLTRDLYKLQKVMHDTTKDATGNGAIKQLILNKYIEAAKEADSGRTVNDIVRYMNSRLNILQKTYFDRLKAFREAEFDAKPVEVRISLVETDIEVITGKIDGLKVELEKNPWNITIKTNIDILQAQLDSLIQKKQALEGKQGDGATVTTVKSIVAEIKAAQAEIANLRKSANLDLDAIGKAETDLDDAKKRYKTATGREYGATTTAGGTNDKAKEEAIEAELEYSKRLKEEKIKAANDREQAIIDTMQDGLDKELAQNRLNYAMRLQDLAAREAQMVEELKAWKEKEWEAANPNGTESQKHAYLSQFDTSSLSDSQKGQLAMYAQIYKETYEQANKQSLNNALKDVATYLQRRKMLEEDTVATIAAMYDEDGNFREGFTQDNVDIANENLRRELAQLDEAEAAKTAEYEIFCNSLTNKTMEQLTEMLRQAKAAMDDAENTVGGNETELALRRAEFNKIVEVLSKMVNEQQAAYNSGTYLAERSKQDWDALGNTLVNCADSIAGIGDAFEGTAGDILKAASTVLHGGVTMIDSIKKLTTTTADAMKGTATMASQTMTQLEKASVILSIISTALQVLDAVNTAYYSIANADEDRVVKQYTAAVESLEDAYERLDDAMEESFGASKKQLIAEMGENILQQIADLRAAEEEELSKKGLSEDEQEEIKKTYSEHILQLQDEYAELLNSARDAIFGDDIQDAIADLADAIVQAWEDGTDASKAFAEQSRDWVKQALQEMLKDYIKTSGVVERIRAAINEAYDSDNEITMAEWEGILALADQLGEQVERDTGYIQDLYNSITSSVRTASSTGIASASQDTVDELNGRMTAVQGHTYSIAASTRILAANTNSILGSVRAIEDDVAYMRRRMDGLSVDLTAMRRASGTVQVQGIKIK